MLDWRRGVGSICHGYTCIVLYTTLIWCHGFPEMYAHLEEGEGSICHGICALCYIWILCGVLVSQRSMLLAWRRGQSAMGICALCYIWNLGGVMVFQRSMVNWRRGVGQLTDLSNVNSFTFHALLHRRSFHITYKRPNYTTKTTTTTTTMTTTTTTTTYRYIYIDCSIFFVIISLLIIVVTV